MTSMAATYIADRIGSTWAQSLTAPPMITRAASDPHISVRAPEAPRRGDAGSTRWLTAIYFLSDESRS
jgi:hypothetical protein